MMENCTGCGRDIEPTSINGRDRKFKITIQGANPAPVLDIDAHLCPGCLLIVKDGADPRGWPKIAASAERKFPEEFSASLSAAARVRK